MQVRVLEETDEPRYRALRLASIEEAPTQASPEIVRELSCFVRSERDVLDNHALEGTRVWGAFMEARLVGVVAATRGFDPGCPGTVHLWGLYVVPEMRGAGIGARLLQAALAWIRRRQAAMRVVLYVHCTNQGTMRWFEGQGFVMVADDALRHTRLRAMQLDLKGGVAARQMPPDGEQGAWEPSRHRPQRANGGIG